MIEKDDWVSQIPMAIARSMLNYIFMQTGYVNPGFTVACVIDYNAYASLQACDDTICDWCKENLNDSEYCIFKPTGFRAVAFTNEVALLLFTMRFSDVIIETAYNPNLSFN